MKPSRSLLVLLSASLLLIDAIGAFSGFPVMDDGEVLTIVREGGLSALGPTHRDRPIYGRLLQEFVRAFGERGSPSLPVTDRVAAALVRLPLHPRLTEEDLDRVVSAVEEAPV